MSTVPWWGSGEKVLTVRPSGGGGCWFEGLHRLTARFYPSCDLHLQSQELPSARRLLHLGGTPSSSADPRLPAAPLGVAAGPLGGVYMPSAGVARNANSPRNACPRPLPLNLRGSVTWGPAGLLALALRRPAAGRGHWSVREAAAGPCWRSPAPLPPVTCPSELNRRGLPASLRLAAGCHLRMCLLPCLGAAGCAAYQVLPAACTRRRLWPPAGIVPWACAASSSTPCLPLNPPAFSCSCGLPA